MANSSDEAGNNICKEMTTANLWVKCGMQMWQRVNCEAKVWGGGVIKVLITIANHNPNHINPKSNLTNLLTYLSALSAWHFYPTFYPMPLQHPPPMHIRILQNATKTTGHW